MRYRIKEIRSRERLRRRAVLMFFILLFFLCFAISGHYGADELPDEYFKTHKKASVTVTEALIFYSGWGKGKFTSGVTLVPDISR